MMTAVFRITLGLVKYVFIFIFLPLYLIVKVINPFDLKKEVDLKNSLLKLVFEKVAIILVTFLVIFPVWSLGYLFTGELLIRQLGYYADQVQVAGTGSMYPTFPKGHGRDPLELSKEVVSAPGMLPYPNGFVFRDKRYFGYEIKRGDIVVIEDEKIRNVSEKVYGQPSGWVKRVIGLPGDTIEIREGLVYLNKSPLNEPYTAQPRSTFGQSFLGECKEVKISDDSIFVMGDNRKGSGDSREVGFIPLTSVNHVLSLSAQVGVWDKNYRDASNDFSEASKIKLIKADYLKLLNDKRKEAGVPELRYQTKLEASAAKRASVALKYDDLSHEATRSGYTMEDSLRDAGYSNIVLGEILRQGYYEAFELLENEFEFPESVKFLLDPDFDEIGISEVEGEINNCPTQIIALHFAGYVPPNYKVEDIESWKNVLIKLQEIKPGWQKLKDYNDFYVSNQNDIDRIVQIIEIRINNISSIVSRMEANQWLNENDKKLIESETSLAKEQDELAKKLNGSI